MVLAPSYRNNRKGGVPQAYVRARASSETLRLVHVLRVFLCIFYIKMGIWYVSKRAWIHVWYVSKPVPPCDGTPLMIILVITTLPLWCGRTPPRKKKTEKRVLKHPPSPSIEEEGGTASGKKAPPRRYRLRGQSTLHFYFFKQITVAIWSGDCFFENFSVGREQHQMNKSHPKNHNLWKRWCRTMHTTAPHANFKTKVETSQGVAATPLPCEE